MIGQARNAAGRSVVMVHYSGHGGPNLLNELELSSRSGKKIAASQHVYNCTTEPRMELDAQVDVIYIFDCCYSFLVTRNTTANSRIVEMVAVGDPKIR